MVFFFSVDVDLMFLRTIVLLLVYMEKDLEVAGRAEGESIVRNKEARIGDLITDMLSEYTSDNCSYR